MALYYLQLQPYQCDYHTMDQTKIHRLLSGPCFFPPSTVTIRNANTLVAGVVCACEYLPQSVNSLPQNRSRMAPSMLKFRICNRYTPWVQSQSGKVFETSVDRKNQLDVTFCILYFSSNSCSTCFGQPCAHHKELTTALCYNLVFVCAVAAGRLSSPVGS